MKTKNAVFIKRIAAAFMCMALVLCMLPSLLSSLAAKAEGEDVALLTLETVDRWDLDGYKIEQQSGVYTDPADETEYTYDYKITISDEIWVVDTDASRRFGINNVNSRPLLFNVSSAGIPIDSELYVSSSSWAVRTSTNEDIAEIGWSRGTNNYKELYLIPKQTVGTTYMTLTLADRTISDEDSAYYGQTVPGGTLRILYECVKKENAMFTFTGLEMDRNNNRNGVWLDGISIPEADSEWTKAEEMGALYSEFYENIFFLEGNEDGTPQDISAAQVGVNDLKTILSTKTVDSLKFQVEVRDDHIELYKQTRTIDGGGANENGNAIDFEEGDAFYFKAGLILLGKDGNTEWCLYEQGFVYNELLRDQYFVYNGEAGGWSADYLGLSISFTETSASVDVGAETTLTPVLSGGNALTEEQRAVTWTSSDEEIAAVSQNGTVTGVATGTATITATTGTGDFASVTVTVYASDAVTGIRLNAANINLNIGGTRTIVATVDGGSAADKSVTWTSSDDAVATVDENGLVTAIAAGTCTITATASDGETSASANVTVRQGSADTGNTDETEEPDGDAGDTSDGDTEETGCGSTVSAVSLALGVSALALGACAIVLIRGKKENRN